MSASALPTSVDALEELLTSRGYLAERSLATVTYLALRMGRPLFLEGEAGVGKTEIAKVLSAALGRKLIRLQCYEGLDVASAVYEWSSAAQMIAIRLAEASGDTDRDQLASDIFAERFLIKRPLLQALEPDVAGPPVLLIDEIDKADIEFPNDLLLELDRMEFHVYETGETIKAKLRPIVMITSNNEKELPDAFLRRCFFHYIKFPDADTMSQIVDVHFPGIKKRLVEEALRIFFEVREVPGLKKKPSTSELLDWLKLLLNEDITPEMLRERDPRKLIPPLHGALLKNEQDVHLFERLAFLSRREV